MSRSELFEVVEDMMEAVRHSDGFRDRILDHMCTVIINTVNEAH